jgi:secreted trypsin-like serine protease
MFPCFQLPNEFSAMLYAGVSDGSEDSCQGDIDGPIFDQESTRSEW